MRKFLGGPKTLKWLIISVLFLLAFSQLVVFVFGFASIEIDYLTAVLVSYFFVGLSNKYALQALFTNGNSIVSGDVTEFGKVVIFGILTLGAVLEVILITYGLGYVLLQFGLEIDPQVIVIGVTFGDAIIRRLKKKDE